ncbi:MAG: antitoxin [Propionibacteriaceae bacterium]|jgi:plasmid stability protein|nr:antitoxin [Propionibacteriaceae bacterium]
MVTMTIRNIPDETRNELAARAARTGRSMQEFLRLSLIDLAARPNQAEIVADIRRHAASLPSVSHEEVLEAIAADRR